MNMLSDQLNAQLDEMKKKEGRNPYRILLDKERKEHLKSVEFYRQKLKQMSNTQ